MKSKVEIPLIVMHGALDYVKVYIDAGQLKKAKSLDKNLEKKIEIAVKTIVEEALRGT